MSATTKGTDCAFPTGCEGDPGLTKREHFAALALQGLLASPNDETDQPGESFEATARRYASSAVGHADALIAELNKSTQPEEPTT